MVVAAGVEPPAPASALATGPASAAVAEPSLVDQIAAVRAGDSDAIKTYALTTNDDLAGVSQLPGLRELLLEETQITDAGVAELKKALPKCGIYH